MKYSDSIILAIKFYEIDRSKDKFLTVLISAVRMFEAAILEMLS